MDALAELVESLPARVVATDPATTENDRFDWSRDPGAGTPVAVVRVESAGQVQTAVRCAGPHAASVWRIGLMVRNARHDAVPLVLAALREVLGRG